MNHTKKICLTAALLLAVVPGRADEKSDAIARLKKVEALTSLDGQNIKPWHLKVTVQLYDEKGKPSEQGEIEEWWAGAQQNLTSYTFPSYTGKVLQTADGTFKTAHLGIPPLLVQLLLDQVVHPLPRAAEVEASEPVIHKQTVGQIALDCIMLSQPLKDVPAEPLGMFPTYCLDAEKDALRATYSFGAVAAVQTSFGTFQNVTVATNVMVNVGPTKVGEAHVAALGGLRPDPAQFAKSDGFEPVGKMSTLPGQFMDEQVLVKVPPFYPPDARSKHLDGVVVLHAIIGRDGHVRSLQVKSADNPDFALSALNAVRLWTYKPYLLNGEPTDVDTTIRVNFRYGGR